MEKYSFVQKKINNKLEAYGFYTSLHLSKVVKSCKYYPSKRISYYNIFKTNYIGPSFTKVRTKVQILNLNYHILKKLWPETF